MPLNPYHNHYTATSEHNLTDQLIIEAIQMKGLLVKYIPRTHNNFDFLYGEDPTSSFESAVAIEMYPTDVQGFGGDGELFSKFGLEARNTATFVVNKTRFSEEFPTWVRPKEGDLIFMPYTNAILEIKFVNAESPFFQQGKTFVWELKTELFEVSHENVSTGDSDVDNLIGSILNFDSSTETDAGGNNTELDTRIDPDITWDPSNPFGVN